MDDNIESVSFVSCESIEFKGTWSTFLDAITIFINKPQVVNKKLCGSTILHQYFGENFDETTPLVKTVRRAYEVKNKDPRSNSKHELSEVERLSSYSSEEVGVISRTLLPKARDLPEQREIICIDFQKKYAAFYPQPKPPPRIPDTDESVQASNSADPSYVSEADDISTPIHSVDGSIGLDGNQKRKVRSSDTELTISRGEPSLEISESNKNESCETSENDKDCNGSHDVEQDQKHVQKDRDRAQASGQGVCPRFAYRMTCVENGGKYNSIMLEADSAAINEEKNRGVLEWLKTSLLQKIRSWGEQTSVKTSVTTLRLVELQRYNQMYTYLKDKYGKEFVKIWPEKTDPQKFVYEDVAIAAYLLVLWEQERLMKSVDKKQSFVDLGCGNGLLVHILSQEGHRGLGLDVRRRNIWDLYGTETNLQEQTICPSAENTFPDYDWLIGNHSDELTPWIPIIATRSHYNCRFFLLPCCHHDFNSKFSHKQPGESCYRSYLNYIQQVGGVCGYRMEEDMLRIPSTKRICFIGRERTRKREETDVLNKEISDFINLRCEKGEKSSNKRPASTDPEVNHTSTEGQWVDSFTPRDSVEVSRNCKGVDRTLTNRIVQTVFDALLNCKDCLSHQLGDGRSWRKGGIIPLSDVVKMFDRDTLLALKSQCGGLQTLLRNHNSVFNVSGGNVQLRDLTLAEPYSKYSKLRKKDNSQYFKTMPCWFDLHHPDGCPKSAADCTFAHKEEELQPRPQ